MTQTYWQDAAADAAMQEEHGFVWRAMLDTIDVDLGGKRVLDAGCNRGGFLRLLADRCAIAEGFGYDRHRARSRTRGGYTGGPGATAVTSARATSQQQERQGPASAWRPRRARSRRTVAVGQTGAARSGSPLEGLSLRASIGGEIGFTLTGRAIGRYGPL